MLKMLDQGIVAEDIKPGSNDIQVFLPSAFGEHTGEIADKKEVKGESTSNSGDGKTLGAAKQSVTVKASWLSWNSNRVTPPQVKKGMAVQLFQEGDADIYKWMSIGGQYDLMHHEPVSYVWGNTKEFKKVFDKNNAHFLTIDPLEDKIIHLHTSKNDGEPVGFDIKLDLKNGKVSYVDTKGNHMKMDAVNGAMDIKTNSSVTVHTGTFTVNAKTINLNAGTINQKAGTNNIIGGKVNVSSVSNFSAKMNCNNNASISGWKSPTNHGKTIE